MKKKINKYYSKKIKFILDILRHNNELSLNYIYGHYPTLRCKKNIIHNFFPAIKGILKVIYFFLFAKINFYKSKTKHKSQDILIIASSLNQFNSLNPLVQELTRGNFKFEAVLSNHISKFDIKIEGWKFQIIEYYIRVLAFGLFIIRFPYLFNQLKRLRPNQLANRFEVFSVSYLWLLHFNNLLEMINPKLIIVANDHNADLRSLLAISYQKNIKTCYVQHGSVSHIFPPLEFDYAFLDGMNSKHIYEDCNKKKQHLKYSKIVTKIYLTGMAKKLEKITVIGDKIGIAINSLDDLSLVKKLCNCILLNTNYSIILRFHPELLPEQQFLVELFEENSNRIEISNPYKDELISFFKKCFCLVSGDSSIQLEAALTGLIPIYYRFSNNLNSDMFDYYGFVKNGLSFFARDKNELLNLVNKTNEKKLRISEKSLKYFSQTYGTKWENKSGELISNILVTILSEIDSNSNSS